MLRGIWHGEYVSLVVPGSRKERKITLSNQVSDLLSIEIGPMHTDGVVTIRYSPLKESNYIIARINNDRSLLRKTKEGLPFMQLHIPLRGTVAENIGEAFVSFATGVIKQIDGALSVV